jgi:transcriptional regulator with XRE-family HTH domain
VGTASRIRSLRIRAGKSKPDVAERLGLNAAWYDDLEQNDDELASTLTLFQAMDLASVLDVTLRELVSGEAAGEEPIPLVELPERIRDHVARTGLSVEALEAQVGWSLDDFLASPVTVTAEVPVAFLQALAAPLAIDWLRLVPDEEAPG